MRMATWNGFVRSRIYRIVVGGQFVGAVIAFVCSSSVSRAVYPIDPSRAPLPQYDLFPYPGSIHSDEDRIEDNGNGAAGTGTLVASPYVATGHLVLTAAHVVERPFNWFRHYEISGSGYRVLSEFPALHITHPDYTGVGDIRDYDLGLLLTEHPIPIPPEAGAPNGLPLVLSDPGWVSVAFFGNASSKFTRIGFGSQGDYLEAGKTDKVVIYNGTEGAERGDSGGPVRLFVYIPFIGFVYDSIIAVNSSADLFQAANYFVASPVYGESREWALGSVIRNVTTNASVNRPSDTTAANVFNANIPGTDLSWDINPDKNANYYGGGPALGTGPVRYALGLLNNALLTLGRYKTRNPMPGIVAEISSAHTDLTSTLLVDILVVGDSGTLNGAKGKIYVRSGRFQTTSLHNRGVITLKTLTPMPNPSNPYTHLYTVGPPILKADTVLNEGTFDTGDGIVELQGLFHNIGTLTGKGQIIGGYIYSDGMCSPGASPGRMVFTGDYAQGANGRLRVEVGGAVAAQEYDQLSVNGAVTLNGSLEVVRLNAFVPQSQQTFEIVTGSSVTGSFANLALPALPDRKTFQVNYAPQAVTLSIVSITTYAEWKNTRFTLAEQANPEVSAAYADADGDGRNNAVEYFLASEPKAFNSDSTSAEGVVTDQGQQFRTLTFSRAQGMTDAVIVIERTVTPADPNSWSRVPFEIINVQPGVNADVVTVKALFPLGTNPNERFRLQVEVAGFPSIDPATTLHLRFDGNAIGSQAETPTLATGLSYSPGVFGQGAIFSAAAQLVFEAAGNANALEGTLDFWIKPNWTGDTTTSPYFLEWGGSGGILLCKNNRYLRSILNLYAAGGKPEAEVGFGATGDVRSGEWIHVAFTWSDTSKQSAIYLNGIRFAENTFSFNLPAITATTFSLGGQNANSANGVIDELRISNRPRTDAEILSTYRAGQFGLGRGIPPAPDVPTEDNVSQWGAHADSGAAVVTNDPNRVHNGASSLHLTTDSGEDTWVVYPTAGNAFFDFEQYGSKGLAFWAYAENNNQHQFQNGSPWIRLYSAPGHYFDFHPRTDILNRAIGHWREFIVPFAGDAIWSRTVVGRPSLHNINRIEFHADTWDQGFEWWIDDLRFDPVIVPGNWINPNGGNFATNANWEDELVPAEPDPAIFNLHSLPYTVSFGADTVVDSLRVLDDTVTLDLAGTVLSILGDSGRGLQIAEHEGDSAVLTLTHGTLISGQAGIGMVGGSAATGRLNISGNDALWQIVGVGETQIGGYAGDYGSLFVTEGGRLEALEADLMIGRNGGSGRMDISGAGSSVETEWLWIGLIGEGEVNVLNGGHLTGHQHIRISNQDVTPTGILTISGQGSRAEAGVFVLVGGEGHGELIISDGGILQGSSAGTLEGSSARIGGYFGTGEAATGIATITGAGSQWLQSDGIIRVGASGAGTMKIFDSGSVSSVSAEVATDEGGQGSVVIRDLGSNWSVRDDLAVGGQKNTIGGIGSVTVQYQGILSVGHELRLWSSGSLDVATEGSAIVGIGVTPVNASVTVGSSGIVSGNGAILGGLINVDGVISPGAVFGRLQVTGPLIQQSGALLKSEIGGLAVGSQYDQLAIAGAATIGGNLEVSLLDNFAPASGQIFTILTANSIAGTFSNLSTPALLNRQMLRISYGAQVVQLFVAPIETYDEWTTTRFTLAEQTDPFLSSATADFDFDGICNKLEYFFGTEPKSANSAAVLVPDVIQDQQQRFLTLTFPRASGMTDATFAIERSGNLSNPGAWITTPFQIINTTQGAGVDILTVRVIEPVEANEFFRLRVE